MKYITVTKTGQILMELKCSDETSARLVGAKIDRAIGLVLGGARREKPGRPDDKFREVKDLLRVLLKKGDMTREEVIEILGCARTTAKKALIEIGGEVVHIKGRWAWRLPSELSRLRIFLERRKGISKASVIESLNIPERTAERLANKLGVVRKKNGAQVIWSLPAAR